MKILSIDVGIKNLALCILETIDKNYKIIKWEVINLCNENNLCNICKKNAKFFKHEKYLCNLHAKKDNLKLPTPTDNIHKIKKLNINELREKANIYDISYNTPITKDKLYNLITDYINTNYFETISEEKSDDYNIIELGINLKKKLDLLSNQFLDLDYIIIENQISPIANRMKSIQGMIAQYFIMKNYSNIEFISAVNKLKLFCETKNTSYNERKKLSIETCKNLLIKNNDANIEYYINHKKKDDLADCFLQGIYYLVKKNILNI